MYQEEIFSNTMTDAKKECFDSLNREVKGMEAALELFFTKILESTSSLAERDFLASSM